MGTLWVIGAVKFAENDGFNRSANDLVLELAVGSPHGGSIVAFHPTGGRGDERWHGRGDGAESKNRFRFQGCVWVTGSVLEAEVNLWGEIWKWRLRVGYFFRGVLLGSL